MSDTLTNALRDSAHSGSVLQGIANPAQLNPLAGMGTAMDMVQKVQGLDKSLAERQAGQAFLNSIRNGQPDQSALLTNLKNDPSTAYAALSTANSGQALDTNTYKLTHAQLTDMHSGGAALLAQYPNGVPKEAIDRFFDNRIAEGIPADVVNRARSNYGADPVQNTRTILQNLATNMDGQTALGGTKPHMGMSDVGPGLQPWQQGPAPLSGAPPTAAVTPVGPQIRKDIGPEFAGQKVTVQKSDGTSEEVLQGDLPAYLGRNPGSRVLAPTGGGGGTSVTGPATQDQLTTITTQSGAPLRVNNNAAQAFSGFLAELEGLGYHVDPKTSSGFNPRKIAGQNDWSHHADGTAIDINSANNPRGASGKMDLPPNVAEIAARHGLTWGGNWSGASRDPMHFEYTGGKPGGANKPGGGGGGATGEFKPTAQRADEGAAAARAPARYGASPRMGYGDQQSEGAKRGGAFEQEGSGTTQEQALLSGMLTEIQGAGGTGFGSNTMGLVRQLAERFGAAPPALDWKNKQASQESLNKLFSNRVQQQNSLGGFQPSDQRSSLAEAGNPNMQLSTEGNRVVVRKLQGGNDALDTMYRAWMTSKERRENPAGFTQWRQEFTAPVKGGPLDGARFDPTVFAVSRMTPEEQHRYLSDFKKASPRDFGQFVKNWELGLREGWVQKLNQSGAGG